MHDLNRDACLRLGVSPLELTEFENLALALGVTPEWGALRQLVERYDPEIVPLLLRLFGK